MLDYKFLAGRGFAVSVNVQHDVHTIGHRDRRKRRSARLQGKCLYQFPVQVNHTDCSALYIADNYVPRFDH